MKKYEAFTVSNKVNFSKDHKMCLLAFKMLRFIPKSFRKEQGNEKENTERKHSRQND